MSDSIFISGLALHAYHGVMPHEAKVGQSFALDLVVDIDLADAGRSDKVADTVSYDLIVAAATQAFCAQRYRLVEAAAGAVADAILAQFPRVDGVRVTVHKPHAPIAATFRDVGVEIVRSRHG
ncbi:MAG: dihydroneopterin aldolase [Xanthobacteraceae bacterium]